MSKQDKQESCQIERRRQVEGWVGCLFGEEDLSTCTNRTCRRHTDHTDRIGRHKERERETPAELKLPRPFSFSRPRFCSPVRQGSFSSSCLDTLGLVEEFFVVFETLMRCPPHDGSDGPPLRGEELGEMKKFLFFFSRPLGLLYARVQPLVPDRRATRTKEDNEEDKKTENQSRFILSVQEKEERRTKEEEERNKRQSLMFLFPTLNSVLSAPSSPPPPPFLRSAPASPSSRFFFPSFLAF